MNSSAIPSALLEVPSGLPARRETLRCMVRLARTYRAHPVIRELARTLVASCPENDVRCELTALQNFVRDNVRYTGDVYEVETVQSPLSTLGLIEGPDGSLDSVTSPPPAAGDCDCKATLLASLMLAIGIPGAFCAVGLSSSDDLSHVLVEARLGPGDYLPLEVIVPGAEPGWSPPGVQCFMLAHFG